MGVKIRNVSGDVLQTSFTDTFNRANSDSLGQNWMRVLVNTPGGAGNGGTCVAQVSGNQALFTVLAGGAPSQLYNVAWIPMPVFSNLFGLRGVFLQVTFQAATLGSAALGLRFNQNMANGTTQVNGSDIYMMLLAGAAAGRIDKIVGGGVQNTIGAGTFGALNAGDVMRFEVLTVGAAVFLQTIRNGIIGQTISDVSATRILNGGPCIFVNAPNVNATSMTLDSFSCGPISALSV